MKSSSSNSPTLLIYQNENIDNPERRVNIFSNYFRTIGKKTQEKKYILIKSILITSQIETLTRFSFHQLTKRKSNLFFPL